MANFRTHLFTASGLGGVAAIACMKAGVAPAAETPMLLGLGALGGLLPDIDSERSVPIRIGFTLLAFFLAFVAMFQFAGRYTVLELAAIWLGAFLGVRYLVLELFIACTTHRGSIHSVLAAAFFGLVTVSLSTHVFAKPYSLAWLYGVFMALGYLVHLLLDEVFSVDLLNRRVKRSFGSALKLASLKYWRGTLLLSLAVAGLYPTVPPPSKFLEATWNKLETHYTSQRPWLMPSRGRWFSDMGSLFAQSFCPDRGKTACRRGCAPLRKTAARHGVRNPIANGHLEKPVPFMFRQAQHERNRLIFKEPFALSPEPAEGSKCGVFRGALMRFA